MCYALSALVWIQDAEPPGAAASLSGISSSSNGYTK